MIAKTVSVADTSSSTATLGAGPWTSIIRGANFVIATADATAGTVLERTDHPDESMLLLVTAAARVSAAGETVDAGPESLLILPPGASRIEVLQDGLLVRIFSAAATDLTALASDAADHADGADECAPLTPWPDPPGGFRLRHYPLADHPNTTDSVLWVFRSTNLMINFLKRWTAPREVDKLSPHSHADFEQASLAVRGRFIHHIRYPWTANLADWRADEHLEVGSPSVTVIPANVVHTSRNIDADAWLIDIFAPPRMDFSLMPGVVKNAADYPMPR